MTTPMTDFLTEEARATSAPIARPEKSYCWRVAADAALQLRFWDGECVLFHGATGDTHRLPEAVGQLIERLLRAPCSESELSEAIDLHEDDVRRSLAELARLGIVERSA